jgi:hypothetical protein
MATMDQAPVFRWCVDLDVLPETARWEDWMLLVRAFVRPMAVIGWFSITRPQRLAAIVRRLRPEPALYAAGIVAPDPFEAHQLRFQALDQFLRWADHCELSAMRDGHSELVSVGEKPSVWPLKPKTLVIGDSICQQDNADHDSSREAIDLGTVHNVGDSGRTGCSMNQERASIVSESRTVLDVLNSSHDQRSPRLANGKESHSRTLGSPWRT